MIYEDLVLNKCSELNDAFSKTVNKISLLLNNRNIIVYSNGISIIKDTDLSKIINISLSKWYTIKKQLNANSIMIKEKYNTFINPIFLRRDDFIWYKEIFDLFEGSIKENLQHFEYLKIKSKFYEVNHDIICDNIDGLNKNISGIYRLYKNDNIVYIGKSKCIKTRISHHIKEKDIDEFDFTIIDSDADKHLYEIYYIIKYKPVLNKDCITNDVLNTILKELIFSDKINLRGDIDE